MIEPLRSDAALSVRGLTKVFAGHRAVDGLSFDIARGELFGFVGPNGAGKTTTIKLVAGLLRPTGGAAMVCGHDLVLEARTCRALVGYVPDQPYLYEKLTGMELLRLVADLYGVGPAALAVRLGPLLETFSLADHAGELVQSYSRGMRQKLALAAALLHDPQLLLLDEPTSGLDPPSGRRLKEVLRGLCAQGRSVLLSTHALEVAELLCDRIAVVVQGRLVALGTADELRERSGEPTLEAAFLRLTGEGTSDLGPLLQALAS